MRSEQKLSLSKSLGRAYRQIIYLLLFISLSIPLIKPIGLPVPIHETTLGVYNTIEALEPGDVVVMASNIGAAIASEVYPQYIAVLEHVLRKDGVKILLVDHSTEAPIWTEKALEELNAYERKSYGEDFVHIGFIPGGESGIAGICRDIHSLIQVDYHGYSLSELPMMAEIRDATDFTIVIDFSASADTQFWLNQAYAPYGTRVAFGLTAVKVPDAVAYYTAGQIFGIIESLKGAAEYEILIKRPGIAAKGMDAQSIAHLLYIGLIVVGNIIFFVSKTQRKR